jgi:hypothetical protein
MAQEPKGYVESVRERRQRIIQKDIRRQIKERISRISKKSGGSNDRSRIEHTGHEGSSIRTEQSSQETQDYLDLDEALVNARRYIGIISIKDFYELTPREYKLLLKGSLYARYDKLQDNKAIAALPVPLAFADSIEEIQNNVNELINSIKNDADKIGHEEDETKKREKEALFANLFF